MQIYFVEIIDDIPYGESIHDCYAYLSYDAAQKRAERLERNIDDVVCIVKSLTLRAEQNKEKQ